MEDCVQDLVFQHKCPNCGGSVVFDPEEQKMKCLSCDSLFDPEEIGDDNGLLMEKSPWTDEDNVLYHCPSCGGDLIYHINAISTKCPYCGNDTILGEHLSGLMRPNRIIPFSIDKEKAELYLRSYIKRTGLSAIKMESADITNVSGIYIPFWFYSSRIYGNAKYVNVPKDGDTEKVKDLYLSVSAIYQNLPVDGSVQLPNDITESLEPYDIKRSVPFDSSYLLGFAADKYDVSAVEGFNRAKQRMSDDLIFNMSKQLFKNSAETYINNNLGYVSKAPITVVQYILCPVWIFKVSVNRTEHTFYVNGQTGKVSGHFTYIDDTFRKKSLISFVISQIIPVMALIFTSGALCATLLLLSESAIMCLFYYWHRVHRKLTNRRLVQYGASQYLKKESIRILNSQYK